MYLDSDRIFKFAYKQETTTTVSQRPPPAPSASVVRVRIRSPCLYQPRPLIMSRQSHILPTPFPKPDN